MEGDRKDQPSPQADNAQGGAESTGASSDTTTDGPRRKRRRRRRKKKPRADPAVAAAGEGATDSSPPPAPAPSSSPSPPDEPAGTDPGWQTLAAGLLSHLDERQVPCKVDGCVNTWTWTAQEQMQAFGQPPPKRMCGEHRAKFTTLEDREVPCANPGCERTWTWPKKAQANQLQRSGSDTPPRKTCPQCTTEERELTDTPAPCRVEGCTRTWLWTRDAQLKHRTWARRHAEDGGASRDKRSGGKRRGRRRRRQVVDVHQPPPRMCAPCRDKLSRLTDREVPCKVHGCTRNAVMDRDAQLRAWAKLGTEDLDAHGPPVRRMCETCRDFCRNHPDREVKCGRPGCDKTWTYKTGAQLQDFLAGRRHDPIRLCPECSKGGIAETAALLEGMPEGMEVMPCVVPLCEGVWFYQAGVTEVAATGWVELPLDRMQTHGPEDAEVVIVEVADFPTLYAVVGRIEERLDALRSRGRSCSVCPTGGGWSLTESGDGYAPGVFCPTSHQPAVRSGRADIGNTAKSVITRESESGRYRGPIADVILCAARGDFEHLPEAAIGVIGSAECIDAGHLGRDRRCQRHGPGSDDDTRRNRAVFFDEGTGPLPERERDHIGGCVIADSADFEIIDQGAEASAHRNIVNLTRCGIEVCLRSRERFQTGCNSLVFGDHRLGRGHVLRRKFAVEIGAETDIEIFQGISHDSLSFLQPWPAPCRAGS